MADEDWDFDDIDFDDDDESDASAESEDDTGGDPDVTKRLERLEKATGKVVKKLKGDQEQSAEALKAEFLEDATDEIKDLADVFDLESLTSRRQVEKAIEKIKARAAKLNPEANISEPGAESDAFAPPATAGKAGPPSPDEKLNKRLREGKIGIDDFLETFEKAPTGEWSYLS